MVKSPNSYVIPSKCSGNLFILSIKKKTESSINALTCDYHTTVLCVRCDEDHTSVASVESYKNKKIDF